MSTPRGVRSNNPGNINFNSRNAWQGQLGLELGVFRPRFARFDSPENGIRALGKLLINYRGKDGIPSIGGAGIDTVRETISRWAPGNENDTEAYIAAVANKLGISADAVINVRDPHTLRIMVGSIIAHECANYRYPQAVFEEGLRRALQ